MPGGTLLLHENLGSARRVANFVAVKPVTVANESVEVEGPVILSLVFVARRRAVGRVASLPRASRVAVSHPSVSRLLVSRVASAVSHPSVSRVAASPRARLE